MKRLFGGATLLFAAISAQAGLISPDFRTGFRIGPGLPGDGSVNAGDEPERSDLLSHDSRWDSGDAWLDLGPVTNTPALQAPDHAAAQAGATSTGLTFLTEPPAAGATPTPEPATLVLFGLGAGALGLARQGKSKRI
jgi:hypothetical protein